MEPDLSRLYAKRLFFLLTGAVPIALIWNVQNRWIAIPVSIVAVLFILVQLNLINGIADAQLAYSRAKRAEAEGYLKPQPASVFKQKWVYNGAIAFFFLLTFFITFTGQKIENYLDWKPLMFDMLKLLWIPFVAAWWYSKRWKVVFEDKEKEDYVQLYSFMIPLLLLFHGMVWYNGLQPSATIATQKIIVDDSGSKSVSLTIKGQQKQYELSKRQFMQIRPLDTVIITVKEGALGYHYISSFKVRQHN